MNENIHVNRKKECESWYTPCLNSVYECELVVETMHFDTGNREIPVQTWIGEYQIEHTVNGNLIGNL